MGFPCLFNNKIPVCKACLMKKLSKVKPHLNMQVLIRVTVVFVVTSRQICQTKTAVFQNTKHLQKVGKRKWKLCQNQYAQSHWWKACQWRKFANPLKNYFQFFNEALKYAQYHFENKLWNKFETLEYLQTWWMKKCSFQFYWCFWTRIQVSCHRNSAKVWGVWHRYPWCYKHSNAFVIFEHKKYMISIIPSLLKPGLV